MDKKLRKDFLWNMIGSLINAATSLLFLIFVTRINGTNTAGIFAFGFSIACLFQTISNYYGHTFQVTNTDDKLSDKDFIYNRIFCCIVMFFIVCFYLMIKDYGLEKNIVIILFVIYRMFESFLDSLYAVIQRKKELYKVGISLFLRGLIGSIIFLIIDIITKNIYISIVGLTLSNLLIFIFYDWKNYKKYDLKKKFNVTKNNILIKTGFYVFIATFLTQYILNAPKYSINEYLSNHDQTIYGILSMPITFIVLCGQFIIQPFLVEITELVNNKDFNGLKKTTFKLVNYIFIIGLICLLMAYLIGIPILELIYGLELDMYLLALMILLSGGILYSIAIVVGTSFLALRKTFIQVVYYGLTSVIIFVLSDIMIIKFGLIGGAFAYSISMFVLSLMYIIGFILIVRRLGNDKN